MKKDLITNIAVRDRIMCLANDKVMPSAKWAKPMTPAPKQQVANNIKKAGK
jgi:hypothetical protein